MLVMPRAGLSGCRAGRRWGGAVISGRCLPGRDDWRGPMRYRVVGRRDHGVRIVRSVMSARRRGQRRFRRLACRGRLFRRQCLPLRSGCGDSVLGLRAFGVKKRTEAWLWSLCLSESRWLHFGGRGSGTRCEGPTLGQRTWRVYGHVATRDFCASRLTDAGYRFFTALLFDAGEFEKLEVIR
ncbi:hypothetical protein RA2_01544 [Roseovarius sp. A-2]|nr:hypothetical protein RA2_01544 [Roseovarius sp. A-2]